MCAVWTSLCVSKFEIGFLAIEEDAWHSDRRLHVISQISLWRWIGKAPLGHDKTCSTVNGSLQAHLVGTRSGNQLYRRANASLIALVYRANDAQGIESLAMKKPLILCLGQLTSSVGDWPLIESWSHHHQVGLYASSLHQVAWVISSIVSWESHCC